MSEVQAEPQMFVVGGAKRGRPKASEPGSTLSIWLPASDHDYYAKLAAQRGESISKTVGLLLKTRWQRGTR